MGWGLPVRDRATPTPAQAQLVLQLDAEMIEDPPFYLVLLVIVVEPTCEFLKSTLVDIPDLVGERQAGEVVPRDAARQHHLVGAGVSVLPLELRQGENRDKISEFVRRIVRYNENRPGCASLFPSLRGLQISPVDIPSEYSPGWGHARSLTA